MLENALATHLKPIVLIAFLATLSQSGFAAMSSVNHWSGAVIHAGSGKVSSGVPVSKCHVISNEHAVRGKQFVTVAVAGRKHVGRVVATDKKNDLSLMKLRSCPIQNYAKISTVQPLKGDKVTSVYLKSGFMLSKMIKSTGSFLGYTNIVTEEDKEMVSMVIDDRNPKKGASGGGVSTEHGLVSVIFGVANRHAKPRTFAVDYFSLTKFLKDNHISN